MEKLVIFGPTVYDAGKLAASMNLHINQWEWKESTRTWADVGESLYRLAELEEYVEAEVFS